MRRYTSLLLTAFLLLLVVVAGSGYLAVADRAAVGKPLKEVSAYTTLPTEIAATLSAAYEETSGVRVNFVPLSREELLERLRARARGGASDEAALVLADSELLTQAAGEGYLVPYMSEHGDQVPVRFRQAEGFWVGVFYDPIVFCMNRDYMATLTEVPHTWQALARQQGIRIGMTDFLAADAMSNLLFSMIAQYGDAEAFAIWAGIHPKVVQYAHYLSNPVRQAGMGEVDVSIAVLSETLRYMHDGYPVRVVYPADGTAALVMGTGLIFKSEPLHEQAAQEFSDWLLSDEAQLALHSHGFYFLPTNPGTMAYRRFAGKDLVLFSARPYFTAEQKKGLLDRWVKEVRLK